MQKLHTLNHEVKPLHLQAHSQHVTQFVSQQFHTLYLNFLYDTHAMSTGMCLLRLQLSTCCPFGLVLWCHTTETGISVRNRSQCHTGGQAHP